MAKQGKMLCIIIALVLTHIAAVINSVRVSQRPWSSYCAAGASIVNCSYRGIVLYHDKFNYSENFSCTVCCDKGTCCQVSTNITLRLYERLNNRNKTVAYIDIIEPVHQSASPTASEEWINSSSTVSDKNKSAASVVSNEPTHQSITDSKELINSRSSISDDLALFRGFNGSSNNFRDMPCFDEWIGFEWIDLSNNIIPYLTSPLCFGNLSILTTLSLRNNMLHIILPIVFNHLRSLHYLYLNDNPTITDWLFLKEAVHIKVVDIRGSCNKSASLDYNLQIPCVKNLLVVHDNSSCVRESVDKNGGCNMSLTWPNIYTLLPVEPCTHSRRIRFYTSSITMSVMSTEQGSTTKNQSPSKPKCVSFANTTFDFLSSGKTCIWFPILILIGFACSILSVVSLLQRRALAKYQDKRYSRRLFKYPPKWSKNEHKLQMQCEHEASNKRSMKNTCARIPPPPSVELPAVPVASNVSECMKETEMYSECYYTIKDSSTRGKIFSEKDMCIIVNLRMGLLYQRWMGTISLSDDLSKCVVFTTITEDTFINNTLHWDEYIKRALELPKNKYLINFEGTGIDGDTVYLVQEHLNCETLEVRLKENLNICSTNASNVSMMMTSEVMRHILGILEGLELLQSYGFLHPGVSAKKVLLTNRGICKLYDFCLEEDAGNIVSVKKSQMVCGRNQFAPEALIRNEYIKASDVWSAANLIWEILSGSAPFSADAETIIDQDPATELPNTWPEKYDALRNDELFKCWRVDPSLRPTMSELRSSFNGRLDSCVKERTYSFSSDTNAGYMPMNKNVNIDGTYGIGIDLEN